MVQLILDYTYEHPFEMLVMTYNSRFPTHSRIPVLLENIIKSCSFDPEKGEVHITRRVKVDLEAPGWLKKMFGMYHVFLMQTLVYNVKDRWMNTASRSLSYKSYITVSEEVSWREHDKNKEWTYFYEVAELEMQARFMGFEKMIEKYIGKSYSSNFDNARKLDADFILEALDKPMVTVLESCEEMIRRTLEQQNADQKYLDMIDFTKAFSFEIEFEKDLEDI